MTIVDGGVTDEEVLAAYPTIPMDHDSKSYWKGCLQRKLLISRCSACGHWIHYPRPMCPKCWSTDVVPTEVSGKGRVYGLVFYNQARGGQGTLDQPYPIASIELVEQEGLRLSTTIVNCRNEDMEVDMPVELTWIDFKGAPAPAFQPVGRATGP